jgi:zinc finger-like protein
MESQHDCKYSTTDICSHTSTKDSISSLQTRRLFGDCALVEIIHLHDCLRNALYQIQTDVNSLVVAASFIGTDKGNNSNNSNNNSDGSNSTEVEQKDGTTNTKTPEKMKFDIKLASELSNSVASRFHLIWSVFQAHSGAEDEFIWPALKMKMESKKTPSSTTTLTRTTSASTTSSATTTTSNPKCGCESFLEQEEYEEDHAYEETMFKQINTTLRRLGGSFRYCHANPQLPNTLVIIQKVIYMLKEQTDSLTQHLEQHLEKEETQCLPMVKKHLTNEEISSLVGNIMGKRSAEMMGKILNLALCALPTEERDDMVLCLKKAMGGTFFEKWLKMGGWKSSDIVGESGSDGEDGYGSKKEGSGKTDALVGSAARIDSFDSDVHIKRRKTSVSDDDVSKPKRRFQGHITDTRLRYPTRYYIKNGRRSALVWNNADPKGKESIDVEIPQFAQSELTPTFHFSETQGGLVLGCEHYARGCKLRHPYTGQLFTCRLCCEEVRAANKYSDETLPVLDRQAVTEILCMQCGALQPAGAKCVNEDCQYHTKPFAKHFCSICHLYDNDENKKIYHCPYCNVCRKGEGLGIDFRHCMRCNACVGVSEYDTHVCIPQRLQGNCPICHDSMFESIEPLRGMQCGHVMHLSCYNQYASRCTFMRISCPLCKQVFDNMRG